MKQIEGETSNAPKKTEPKRRRRKFDIDKAVELAKLGRLNSEIYRTLGITRTSFYEMLRRRPKYKAELDKAREEGTVYILLQLRKRIADNDLRAIAIWLKYHSDRQHLLVEERESEKRMVDDIKSMTPAEKKAKLTELLEKAELVKRNRT